jgi:ABC-2 type transport system permease protein
MSMTSSPFSQVLSIVGSELRRRRFYLLWWSLGILLLVAFTVLAYGSVRDQADQLNKAFGDLSGSIGSFVGTTDMFSPVGYLNSQLYYITLPVLFILLSVTLASSLLNKEESHHTLELLLARPVSRTALLGAKALAGAIVIGILGVVTTLCITVCSLLVHIDIPMAYLLLTTAAMVLFSTAFGMVAFMLYAASGATRRLAAVLAIIFSFGGYILSSVSGLVHGLGWVAKLVPYHYYDPGAILNGKLSHGLVLYVVAIYAVSWLVAALGFRRRDIA